MSKELRELLDLLGGIETVYEQLNEQILFNLRNKSIEQLKKELQYDPPEVLQHVYELAFAAERYEVCGAVKQLQMKDEPVNK